MPRDNELMAVTGFRSTHALCTLVEHLVDPAFLVQEAPDGLLSGHHFADLSILGTVAAGFPSPADEELTDTMSLDAYLIANKEAKDLRSEIFMV